jgi:succinate dehydrogenase / fumarate reductase cytochrome b subunit
MVKRPLSPHLSIYKPQLTSVTSIIGRLCGIYTYILVIVALWAIITSIYRYNNASMPLYAIVMFLKSSSPVLSIIAYIITFVTLFCVTFFSGTLIRHILWDYGFALDVKRSNSIAYAIIFSSIALPIYIVLTIAML